MSVFHLLVYIISRNFIQFYFNIIEALILPCRLLIIAVIFMKKFIEFLENLYGDEKCLDDEIIEALYDFSSQQEIVASSLDETDSDQKREMLIPDL